MNKPILIVVAVLATVVGCVSAFVLGPFAVWLLDPVDNSGVVQAIPGILCGIVLISAIVLTFKKKYIIATTLIPFIATFYCFSYRINKFEGHYGKCVISQYDLYFDSVSGEERLAVSVYNMFGKYKFHVLEKPPIIAYDENGDELLIAVRESECDDGRYLYTGNVYDEWGNFMYSLPSRKYNQYIDRSEYLEQIDQL